MMYTRKAIQRPVSSLVGAWIFLFAFLDATASAQERDKALASGLLEREVSLGPNWIETFPDNATIPAAGEYDPRGEAALNVESFSALTLEPSMTSTFEVFRLPNQSQIVFQDTKSAVRANPNFDSSKATSSANFPYIRNVGSTTGFGWVDREFTDVRVEGIVNTEGGPDGKGSKSRQGMMARWDKGNNFYWFYVNFATGRFGIIRSRFFGIYTDLKGSTGAVKNFNRKEAYYLEFNLIDDTLSGKVFEVSSSGGKGKLLGNTGKVRDPHPHLRGVSGMLAEIAMEAAEVPLEGSFGKLISTSLAKRSGSNKPEISFLRQQVERRPELPTSHFHLAQANLAIGDLEQAVEGYRAALRLDPEFVEALDRLAWLQATSKDRRVRNAEEAVEHAERLVNLVHFGQFRRPNLSSAVRAYWPTETKIRTLNTLAAAYAAAGRFESEGFRSNNLESIIDAGSSHVAALPFAQMAVEVAQHLNQVAPTEANKELLTETLKNFESFQSSQALFLEDPRR